MADHRTLDNPNDIAIREQQKQQRLAQGAALASKAKQPIEKPEFSESFTFRFRKIQGGSFSGLWELSAMKGNGKVDEIITDADALPHVLDMIGNIFANRGF